MALTLNVLPVPVTACVRDLVLLGDPGDVTRVVRAGLAFGAL